MIITSDCIMAYPMKNWNNVLMKLVSEPASYFNNHTPFVGMKSYDSVHAILLHEDTELDLHL